ncbi:MAG: Mur ligase family protein [Candidatus Saccharibacteria bacterium]
MFKLFIQKKLESYVKAYFKKHAEVKLVVVTGSVGKTSTKVAVATVLSERFRVRLHEGNFNTFMSVPTAILGIEYPSNIKSISAWLAVFRAAKERINSPTDVDVIVQELGSDRIGQVPYFGTYLHPEIAVITAISPEHMEFFHTIDNVAREELSVANFSKQAIINKDDISGEYAKYLTNANISTYGTSASAEYHYLSENYSFEIGHNGIFIAPELTEPVLATVHVLGEHTLRPAIAAAAVAVKLGMEPAEIANGLSKVHALPGRMNILNGANETILIDDTYNSSPLAVESSLRELYKISVPQRIAVLGDMNELGDTSDAEHKKLGEMCDPNQLAWVVTVGDQAEKFVASAAKARGCQVKSFRDALQAGGFVRSVAEKGAAILFKGSQGGVYLEEAVKVMLHSTSDESQLVRQSPEWLAKKATFFSRDI